MNEKRAPLFVTTESEWNRKRGMKCVAICNSMRSLQETRSICSDRSVDGLIERDICIPLRRQNRGKKGPGAGAGGPRLQARVLNRRTMSMAAANSVNRKEATTSAAAVTSDELVFTRKLNFLLLCTPPPPIDEQSSTRHSCRHTFTPNGLILPCNNER